MLDLAQLILFLLRSRFTRFARLRVLLIVVMGMISGAASTGLIVLINSALADQPVTHLAGWFVVLCAVFPLARFCSDVLLNQLSERSLFELRVNLSRQILATSLPRLESLGPHRLLATLTNDVATITAALAEIPLLCRHLTTVVGCLIYMGWLSPQLLLMVLGFLLVGVVTYRIPVVSSLRYFSRSREQADQLFRHFRGLTEGTKDLMMDRRRAEGFLSKLLRPAAASVRDLNVRGGVIYSAGNSWGQVLFFLAIGLTLFVFSGAVSHDPAVRRGFTLAILFILTPLDVILNVLPRLSRASVAVRKIDQLGLSLDPADLAAPAAGLETGWQRLELAGVSYEHKNEADDERFLLGPLDLTFRPGELVFIVGGNGSGKTTLSKLLVGLYRPCSGQILVDSQVIDDTNVVELRQLFSVIFSDSFLFDSLVGFERSDLDDRVREYLALLRLDHKVRVDGGTFSTIDLSLGQRKRLMLLSAYVQDSRIYLFDEWASGQDVDFKDFFYLHLLPDLRAKGKTVIAITHDDRYFQVADRIVGLEDGNVKYDIPAAAYHHSGLPESPGSSPWHRALTERTSQAAPPLSSHPRSERKSMYQPAAPAPESLPSTPVTPPVLPRPRRILRRVVLTLLVLVAILIVAVVAGSLWLRSELAASLPQLDGERAIPGLTATVTVERDALGVPTLRATSRLDAARALGFLHGQDRFFQMDLLRRKAAGELSEIFGPDALEADRSTRVHRFRHLARRNLRGSSPEEKALMEAYTAGVNAGLSALAAKPVEYLALGIDPAPWKAEDTILVVFAMFLDLHDEDGSRESNLGLMNDMLPGPLFRFLAPVGTEWDAPISGEPFAALPIPGPAVFDLRQQPPLPRAARFSPTPAWLQEERRLALAGSNNWAVDGTHTADGRALLANDMHLELRVPNIWYRTSLIWPDGAGGEIRVTGITLPGAPIVVVGSNGHVAWGFTNTFGDWTDLIQLEMDSRQPEVYRTPRGPRRLERTVERIRIKGEQDQEFEVHQTIWGPVIDRDYRGRPRALAWTAHRPGAVNLGILGLETARNLDEALAVANRSGIPPQNFVAVDESGRIGWTIIGRVPRRIGFEGRTPTSWADGTHRWDGWLAPEEVPRVVDPPSGRLWTANARTVDGQMLARLGDGGYMLGARARQIRDDLFALRKATPKNMLAIQLDDRAVFLERWRKLLLDVLTPQAVAADPRRREMRQLVAENWTGRASVNSAGYRLVRAWRSLLMQQVFGALTARCKQADSRFEGGITPQSEGPLWKLVTERPVHLLDPRFQSWDEQLLASVDETLKHFEENGGGRLADHTWGERNTTSIRHPLSHAVPFLGRWLDMPATPLPGDEHMPRVQAPDEGASERLVISPGQEEKGFFHMPGGQSGHPGSPYYRAGHSAWEEGKPTPFLPGKAQHRLRLVPVHF